MKETPQARAVRLMEQVDSLNVTTLKKGEVKQLLKAIADMPDEAADERAALDTCRAPVSLPRLRRGDVFIAKLVGGKIRPWITLRANPSFVTAIPLSSGDSAPEMTPSKCRYWPGNFIGSAVCLFDPETAGREVTRPYTNLPHLAEIENKIAKLHGFGAVASRNVTMAEIAARYAKKVDA